MEDGGKLSLEEKLARDPAWFNHPLVQKFLRSIPVIILVGSLFLLYGYFLAHKIDLTTADLGRHIKNGEMLLAEAADSRGFENADGRRFTVPSVLETNVYSYTYPESRWVNHHWASGVLSYAAWKLFGFVGIQLGFILLSFATLAVFLFLGKFYAGWGIAGFLTLAAIPLLGERTEVRPEVISYLFSGIFFLILCRYRETAQQQVANTYGRRYLPRVGVWLWTLPLIEVLWVNLHVYFLLGPLIVGAFLLESLLVHRAVFGRILLVFAGTVAAMLANPFGVKAFTAAVTIFENYGYRLAENQPVWFMEKIMPEPNFLIFKVLFFLLALSFVLVAVRNRHSLYGRAQDTPSGSDALGRAGALRLSHIFVAAGMSIMAWFAIRNIALFGFFFIPIAAAHARSIWGNHTENRVLAAIAAASVIATLLFFALFSVPRHFPYWREFGLGLEAGNSAAIEFLSENKIEGPIFNNYDIGGYLIFHLFPREKVFVDNRPEAYPPEFFTDEYIPMQENDEKWREELARYNFNALVFAYHDATPWGQKFLVSRIRDPEWAPVFADSKVLILLRRGGKNDTVIRRFELPREIFRISGQSRAVLHSTV